MATGLRSQRGANSVRKMAHASASGTAIASARAEEYKVPKMRGSAPNCPETGSQALWIRKPKQNFAIAGQAVRSSSAAIMSSTAGRNSARTVSTVR